ncbi:enoyl-CoA hydratase-related protein [Kamptonema cortianum]|jgi:methylglutaconyl-CoA hydratase|nr:enoyl-CoA hydratase-related protein [Geitlerinema splendidum]MDK3154999.1 enoyl-CoA hydratase-related protein [Kamptonema cortianum]
MDEEVLFSIDEDKIAKLTLNRPEVHNALDEESIRKIRDFLKILYEDPTVRALVVVGNGKSFCSGADLHWMERASEVTEAENVQDANLLFSMLSSFNSLPIPVLTYVHGLVMGGGIGIIGCSDIVISDSKTVFGFPEVKLGLAPAIISPYVLKGVTSRLIRRYFLTGENFDATKALQIGLIHEIVDADSQEKALAPFLRQILIASPNALRQTKKLLSQLTPIIGEKEHQTTVEMIARLRRSEEGLQGIDAFLRKKSPPWMPERFKDD